MTQKTALSVMAVPGRVQSFSPKAEFVGNIVPGAEFTVPTMRADFTLRYSPAEFTLPTSTADFTVRGDN